MAIGGKNAAFVLAQHIWEGLQTAKRREVAEHARRVGCTVFTAMADDAPLHAEVM